MGRLSLRILLLTLLSLLQYASAEEPEKVEMENCAFNKVCAIFGTYNCKVNGVRTNIFDRAGFVFEDDTSCTFKKYGEEPEKSYEKQHQARLDFEPITLRSWSFVLHHWYIKDDENVPAPLENIRFDFGGARLSFPDDENVQFEWKKEETDEWQEALSPMQLNSSSTNPQLYSFNISSEEHLAPYFAKKSFTFIQGKPTPANYTLVDPFFVDRLNSLLLCDSNQLSNMSKCHGGCDELRISNETAEVACSSNSSSFWFHDSDDSLFTRKWKEATEIKCYLGNWQAQSEDGKQMLKPTMEVQCSEEKPARMQAMTYGLIGGGCAIFLLVAAALTVYFVWRSKKRRDSRSRSDAPTFSTPSTPGYNKSSSKRMF